MELAKERYKTNMKESDKGKTQYVRASVGMSGLGKLLMVNRLARGLLPQGVRSGAVASGVA